MLADSRAHPERQRVEVVRYLTRARLDDADAAFARDERRVDVVQIRVEEAAHQSLQHGGGDRIGLEIRRFTAKRERQLHRRVGDQLRGEPAELLTEREMGSEYFELFGRQRRDIYRLPNRALDQKLSDLKRDIDRDLDLRLVGCGAEMRRRNHGVEMQQR